MRFRSRHVDLYELGRTLKKTEPVKGCVVSIGDSVARRNSACLPLTRRAYMKNIFILAFFLHTSAFAQPSMQCQLMQQRVLGKSSDPKLCLAIYQQCSENVKLALNEQVAQNQCSVGLGECQMGGALSGESLQQAIEHYKKMCEKANK